MRRLAGLLVSGLVPSACVLGTERPPSRIELARAPAEPGSMPVAATGTRVGCSPATEERPPPPRGHAVWIDGYCHYEGVHYRWQPGRWEVRPPAPTEGPR